MSTTANALGTFSFRVRVGIGATLLIFATIATMAFALWPNARSSLAFGVAAGTSAAAGYAAFFASATLAASLQQHRQRLAIDMLDRLDTVEFNRQRTLLERCDLKGMAQAAAYEKIVSDDQLYEATRAVLNRLEGIASAVELGAVDEHLMYSSLRSLAIRYYDYCHGFIVERRGRVSATAWCQLGRLVDSWRAQKSLTTGRRYSD